MAWSLPALIRFWHHKVPLQRSVETSKDFGHLKSHVEFSKNLYFDSVYISEPRLIQILV